MCSRSYHGLVVSSQGHGDEAHGYRAGFGFFGHCGVDGQNWCEVETPEADGNIVSLKFVAA